MRSEGVKDERGPLRRWRQSFASFWFKADFHRKCVDPFSNFYDVINFIIYTFTLGRRGESLKMIKMRASSVLINKYLKEARIFPRSFFQLQKRNLCFLS